MGGRIKPEQVAGLFRNGWQDSSGISTLVGWESPAFRKAVKERYPELLNKDDSMTFR